MYVKNIVICDCEKQYAKNLLQIFSGKKVAGIRLYLFDTVEEAAEFRKRDDTCSSDRRRIFSETGISDPCEDLLFADERTF